MQQTDQFQETQDNPMRTREETTCCVVGGGPAGVVLALLLARQGIEVTLLEEHLDFARDFRGDTVHPSTMEILEQIGLADRVLRLDHTRVSAMTIETTQGDGNRISFEHLKTRSSKIASARSRLPAWNTCAPMSRKSCRLLRNGCRQSPNGNRSPSSPWSPADLNAGIVPVCS